MTFAQAGLVAFAADYLRDGERIKPGRRPRSPPAAQRAAVAWFQRWLAVRPEP